MKGTINVVDASWMGRSFASDPDLVPPPTRPRLLPELVMVPIGDDGVLFAGGERTEVIKGRSARTLLPRLLPRLDGTHTLDELAALCTVTPLTLRDVIALLYSRGLLEDGPASERERAASDPDLVSFLGRFIDVSRSNRHREQALHRLQTAEVFVAGTGERAELLAAALRRLAIGTVRVAAGDAAGALPPSAALVVAIAGDEADDLSPVIEAAWAGGVPCLHLRIGADETQVGPMFRRGQTGCYGCFRRLFGVPAGVASTARGGFWVGVASLHVLHYLARLAKSSVHGGIRCYETEAESGALTGEALSAPAIPGCEDCGIPGRPLDPADPAFLAWVYHSLVQFPDRELLSPKEHQNHYAISNVQLTTVESQGFAGAATTALAPPQVIGSAPWLAGPGVGDRALDRDALTAVLARSAGWADDGTGKPRRVAPTGGSLGSVELFAVVRDVDGLAPGTYYYNASRHTLERLRGATDAELATALGTADALPPCVVVGVGSFAKTQQKYSAFGYRLIYLDAGVATTYVHAIAAADGLATRDYADYDDALLTRAIGLPASKAALPTFAIALSRRAQPASAPSRSAFSQLVTHELITTCGRPGHDPSAWPTHPVIRPGVDPVLRGLDQVMLARRAVRSYAPRPLDPGLASALVSLAGETYHRRVAIGGADAPVSPLAAIRLGTPELPAGIYSYDRAGPLVSRRDGLTLAEMRDCVIQNSLAAAPLAIYFMADLERGFARRGPRGYREAAVHAGAMAAQVWLAATSFGLAACAAGGVAPPAISRLSGIDGYHGCTLFAIFVGERADAAGPA